MITYKKLGMLRVAEIYFDENPAPYRADIVRHLWRPAPVASAPCEPSHTLVLDLSGSSATLLANMHAETRYRIRRAEKDHFLYDFWSAGEPDAVAQLIRFYNRFAWRKHLTPANRQRLAALGQLGTLDLSRVSDHTGRVLVWHAYYRGPGRVRGIYSASLLGEATEPSLRSLIGRANCYHTWRDILRFQQQGLAVYDLGGWYGGAEDQEKLRINTFKENFGGTVIPEFNSEAGVTPRGRLALGSKWILLDMLRRSRTWKPLRGAQRQTAPQIQ
jgi:hypothetical protein